MSLALGGCAAVGLAPSRAYKKHNHHHHTLRAKQHHAITIGPHTQRHQHRSHPLAPARCCSSTPPSSPSPSSSSSSSSKSEEEIQSRLEARLSALDALLPDRPRKPAAAASPFSAPSRAVVVETDEASSSTQQDGEEEPSRPTVALTATTSMQNQAGDNKPSSTFTKTFQLDSDDVDADKIRKLLKDSLKENFGNDLPEAELDMMLEEMVSDITLAKERLQDNPDGAGPTVIKRKTVVEVSESFIDSIMDTLDSDSPVWDSPMELWYMFVAMMGMDVAAERQLGSLDGLAYISISTEVQRRAEHTQYSVDLWDDKHEREGAGGEGQHHSVGSFKFRSSAFVNAAAAFADGRQLIHKVLRKDVFTEMTNNFQYRTAWIFTGKLAEGDADEVRACIQSRLDENFPGANFAAFLLPQPEGQDDVCAIIPEVEDDSNEGLLDSSDVPSGILFFALLFFVWVCLGLPSTAEGPDTNLLYLQLGVGLYTTYRLSQAARILVLKSYGCDILKATMLPFAAPGLGLVGSTIALDENLPNRKAMTDVALAGSAVSCLVSLAMVYAGLHVVPEGMDPFQAGLIFVPCSLFEHSSWLLALAGYVQTAVVRGADDQLLTAFHPLTLAGLLGLNYTALNLLPANNTDGYNLMQAVYGRWPALFFTTGVTCVATWYALFEHSAVAGWWLFAHTISSAFCNPVGSRLVLNEVTDVGRWRLVAGTCALLAGIICLLPNWQ